MKILTFEFLKPSKLRANAGLFILALIAFVSVPALAVDVVYVSSYVGSTLTTCPAVCNITGVVGTDYSSFGSTSISSAPGAPSRTKTVYYYGGAPSWSIQPTLNVPGAIYQIDVAHTAATTSANVVMTATVDPADGTLSPSCANSSVFNAANGGNAWKLLGYITNAPGITQPVITFTYVSGTLGPTSSSARLYNDIYRFTEINPCSGVAGDVTVTGPLAEGQAFVNVLAVDAAATNITVYADNAPIGTLTSGIVAGLNSVPTSALVRNSEVKATQTKNGCVSSLPGTGAFVGGGANPPQVSVFLSCWKNVNYAGPIGTNAAAAVTNYILKSTGLVSGSQSAPTGGELLVADQCWHTVTFDHAEDPATYPNNGFNAFGNTDPFCSLEALVFAIDSFDPSTGPYDIYVDEIKNGDVVIENFEGVAAGTTNRFLAPNATATPNPTATYLTSPNSALVSQNNAFDGTNALRVQFQYADTNAVRWTRVIANATTAKRYPQLDTTKKITIRYLILPVGQTTNKLHFPVPPLAQTKTTNETATFSVTAAGESPFTYQWYFEDAPIDGATDSSYSKSNVQLVDAGTYSVLVTANGGSGCSATIGAELTVTEFVAPPTITYTWNGTALQLNWTGTFNLESKTNLSDANWTSVGVSTGPYNVPLTQTATFYRLHNP